MSEHEQERSAALQRLDAFVGTWDVELVFPGDPPFTAHAPAGFEWLDERRFFLVYRAETEWWEYTVERSVIGAVDTKDTYTMLSSDSCGVARLCQMSGRDGVWRQWRDDPTCYQRFAATFSDSGRTIKGACEKSPDGKN